MEALEHQLLLQFIHDHRPELLRALVYLLSRNDTPVDPETIYNLYCLLEHT
jgi:hypothetical protein